MFVRELLSTKGDSEGPVNVGVQVAAVKGRGLSATLDNCGEGVEKGLQLTGSEAPKFLVNEKLLLADYGL